jgi:hypothetical protein
VRAVFSDLYGANGTLVYPRMQPGSEPLGTLTAYGTHDNRAKLSVVPCLEHLSKVAPCMLSFWSLNISRSVLAVALNNIEHIWSTFATLCSSKKNSMSSHLEEMMDWFKSSQEELCARSSLV